MSTLVNNQAERTAPSVLTVEKRPATQSQDRPKVGVMWKVAPMNKYIFPIALIVLDFGAAVVYALSRDFKMAVYWVAAAVLNICVTF